MKRDKFTATPWCARCGWSTTRIEDLDAHELRSRARGGSITDPANVALLCRTCHDYITTHPVVAAAEGWAA